MKYCPYCGADIPDGAVSFCAECGKALPAKKEKPEKSTPMKKSSAGKKKKHKSSVLTDAELRKAYNDGYGFLCAPFCVQKGHLNEQQRPKAANCL